MNATRSNTYREPVSNFTLMVTRDTDMQWATVYVHRGSTGRGEGYCRQYGNASKASVARVQRAQMHILATQEQKR